MMNYWRTRLAQRQQIKALLAASPKEEQPLIKSAVRAGRILRKMVMML